MNEEVLKGLLTFPFPLIGFLLGGLLMLASMNFRQFYAGLAVIAVTACLYLGGGEVVGGRTQGPSIAPENENFARAVSSAPKISVNELLPDGELETPAKIRSRIEAILAEESLRKEVPKTPAYEEKLKLLSEQDLNKLLEAEKNKLERVNVFMKRLIEERDARKLTTKLQEE